MREKETILAAYDTAKASGTGCVLATVVHVEGSSYRKAGARMLVDEHGQMTGAISGGCLEGDALRKALHALHQNQNKLITYDTSDESDAVIGAQLGCNGVIQVLFEPLHFDDPANPAELLRKVISSNQKMVVVSLFNLQKTKPQGGTLVLIDAHMDVQGKPVTAELLRQLTKDAGQALADQSAFFGEYHIQGEAQHAFFEMVTPPPALVLVGAGNDAQILAQMADLLGWKITVADGRPSHASANRFVSGCQVVVTKPENILNELPANERTACVLMTHNYQYDLAVLQLLIEKREVAYIGILGPRKKFQRMLDDLNARGVQLSEAQLTKIHAPVGLNLGAETPAEIGLSILAELQGVFSKRDGTPLRALDGPIHDRRVSTFKVVNL